MQAERRIRVLSEETVNRVAAGEVVERPAAALKELLENSVDAGAGQVDVELARAGTGLIRVSDDGAGMDPDDLLLALERHATSKIASVEDLASVTSFGFRGEALPSIAAVSRLRIETRPRGAAAGTRLDAEGGRILRVAPCGCPEGTRVEVRDLFQSVPARLKFLRAEATELGHCIQVATRLALALPGLAVSVRHGDRELLRLAPARDAGARLREHLGREMSANLLPVRGAAGACAVTGFVSRPGTGRPGADYQQLFVNSRPVRDPVLAQGLRETCRDYFLHERIGLCYFLWLALPPDTVDVNVHPTKREVRFRDPGAVRAVVAGALREALRDDRSAPLARASAPAAPEPSPVATAARASETPASSRYAVTADLQERLALPPGADAPSPGPVTASPAQLFDTYVVCPGPDGLVLVDQHAAHERILYERLLARQPGAGAQRLLEPILFEAGAAEEPALEALAPALSDVGVTIEPIGPRRWRVIELPPELPAPDAVGFIRGALAAAIAAEPAAQLESPRHRAAALLACHGAIRANQRLSPVETAALLAELSRTATPGLCPHGRPTSIAIGRAEIERRFKRS